MMLVGPMKKKIILTSVIWLIVCVVICFGVFFFLSSNYNKTIDELSQGDEQRYVFKENFPAGHIIAKGDLIPATVKVASVPSDSYKIATYVTKNNMKEIREATGVNFKEGDTVKWIDFVVGKPIVIDVLKNTVLTKNMLLTEDSFASDDLRLDEFSMISLPSNTVENDFIDVRILFPTGEDYSVLIGKKVEKYTENTVFLRLSEEEILTMGSAIIEAYMYNGAKLYATKYVDPENQLYNHIKVDYVAKYNNALNALIAEKKEAAIEKYVADNMAEGVDEEELRAQAEMNVVVTKADVSTAEIAAYIKLSEDSVTEIEDAIATNNTKVLDEYKNKIVVERKSIERTYAVKPEVLTVVKNNPNILAEVKANFDETYVLSQAIKEFEIPTRDDDEKEERIKEAYDRIIENVKNEIDTKRLERVSYLKTLINSGAVEE